MARKVIIDCDPGIDDAVALCMALFDPRLEVVAITATAGNVQAEQATRNVQAVIERLDPPRYPRVGVASPPEVAPEVDARNIHGNDGLGNADFAVSLLHHQHPSEKIICDEVRAAPDEVTILCLGPLTNIARAFQRDPGLANIVDRLIVMGGSVNAIGNITPTAEFNLYMDPISAQQVFRSPTTKTLVPLDVTQQIRFTLDLIDDLPDESTRAGAFLRRVLPYLFRAYHEQLGQESVHLHDAVAVAAAVNPELFETTDLIGDVETRGRLTTGMAVFDRRPNAVGRPNMEVAIKVDAQAVIACILRGLMHAGRA